MTEPDQVESELSRIGRSLRTEPVREDLVSAVLTSIQSTTKRRRTFRWWHWLRARRRRLVAALILIVLLVVALTPPVRAAVVGWLRIGGVMITGAAPPSSPPLPAPGGPRSRELPLDEARALVDFPIGVPADLGAPDRVTVTDDRRVIGMDWTVGGRSVHLDQLDGSLSYAYLKRNWSTVTPTEVDGAEAVWLADSHEIVYVDRAGVERTETARLSGPSLVWQPQLDQRRTTARLEGITELDEARTIAESLD